MADYMILTDSCCDLSEELVAELGVQYVPLKVTVEGKTYSNWLDGREIGIKEFYDKMRGGAVAKTAAANPVDWEALMEPILAEGKDILVIAFSSGLSSTHQAAVIAGEELQPRYPDRKIYVVDSLAASSGEGLLVWYAVNQQKAGAPIEDVRDWLEANKLNMAHWFTVDDLVYLKRGGRVSATTALVGTVLGIKPVLHVDDEGHLVSVEKTRGRKASLKALVDHMEKSDINPNGEMVYISHSDSLEDAQWLADEIRGRMNVGDVKIFNVGPVIGSHSGPGTMALFFMAHQR